MMAVADDLCPCLRLHLVEPCWKLVERNQRLVGQPRELVLPVVADVDQVDRFAAAELVGEPLWLDLQQVRGGQWPLSRFCIVRRTVS